MNCEMSQVTSLPALTVKVITLVLVKKNTSCASELQLSSAVVTRGHLTIRMFEKFWELHAVVIPATIAPIEKYPKFRRLWMATR